MQRCALLLLAVAALASAPAAAGPKKYFLTTAPSTATGAPAACGKGYHMASLFELLDLAQLKYDTRRGQTTPDTGSGPPASVGGWIRTGNVPDASSSPGVGNCSAWTSNEAGDYGSVAELELDWTAPALAISPWVPDASPCSSTLPVWCRQN